jgi:hypothetical protein
LNNSKVIDVTFDALRFVPLPTALANTARDIALQAIDERDLPHEDLIPAGILTAQMKDADVMVLVPDRQERPDMEVPVEEEVVSGSAGERQVLPEFRALATEDGQAGSIEGSELLRSEKADLFQVLMKRILPGPAQVHCL